MKKLLSVYAVVHGIRKLGLSLFVLVNLVAAAWATTLTLVDPVSSKMPDGSRVRFTDESNGRLYHATVHTYKPKNFLRRGSVRFEFEEPVTIVKKEGVVKSSRKKQIIVLGSVPLVAKLADDAVDGAVGTSKARYVALGAAVITLGVMNGGNVKLKPGYKVEVFQEGRPHSAASIPTPIPPQSQP